MPSATDIQTIIEDAIADVLEASLPRLRAEIARQAAEEVESLIAAAGESPVELLSSAVTSIQETASQAEILRRFLEGAAQFAGRVALFVVKGKSIAGWQALGLENNESVKTFNLNTSEGLVAQAIQDRKPVNGPTQEFDAQFEASLGAPVDGLCLVIPLVVKQKVAAILYADRGVSAPGSLDTNAIALLTQVTALWIELNALRKAASGGSDDVQPIVPPVPVPEVVAPPLSPAEAEVHKKARRFAKLLVEEIKLYNTPKVEQGRQNKDLYDRLKDDIEKSRATYDKRYGETPAASVDYFTEELIRVLTDNDVSLLGDGFPR
ncbi:MAG TPA: GAF domain-containing protein [Candidatus Angelobacter sp.]|nr:GAF domain-containing protein [Candidatus Angelobacter sp.]